MYNALRKAVEVVKTKQQHGGPGYVPSSEETEALHVAASLLHEFQRGGIRLADDQRHRITELSTKVDMP